MINCKSNIVLKFLFYCLLFVSIPLHADNHLHYHSADDFPLLGKATNHTKTRYERLPDSLENTLRKPLWRLGENSTGLALRFRSNSTTIAARWSVKYNAGNSNLTPINAKGVDLYCLVNGQWRFVNSGKPSGKENDAIIISNMKSENREYMLYLSLSDNITSLEIGIDSEAYIGSPEINLPKTNKPVVCYGSSIQQGISASRPGMVHTSILSRIFNREFINLGFSGNAKLDYEIAQIMSEVDASLFILDFVPNASDTEIRERTEYFYKIIRDKHPYTPILFVEDPLFTHTLFDQRIAREVKNKNIAINEVVELLKNKYGDKNISLISSKDMIGNDGEATIDGIHFTDLGYTRYADLLYPIIKKHMPNE